MSRKTSGSSLTPVGLEKPQGDMAQSKYQVKQNSAAQLFQNDAQNVQSGGLPDEHHIGYHPTLLHKFKEPLHNAEGVAFTPDGRIIVADKHDDHVWVFNSDGTNPHLLAKGVKATGIATNQSGLIAFLDIRDQKHALVKVTWLLAIRPLVGGS